MECTKLEELQSMYSDMYKEAYDIRPRHVDPILWNCEDLLISEINHLETVIVQEIEWEREHHRRVAEEKEALARKTKELCNVQPLRVSLFELVMEA